MTIDHHDHTAALLDQMEAMALSADNPDLLFELLALRERMGLEDDK